MGTKKTTTKTNSKKSANSTKPGKATAKNPGTAKTAPAKKVKSKAATDSEKKMSALEAAAKVLAESKEPMKAKEIVEQMTAKGYWTSPGGKTPHATVVAAIIREIRNKGEGARFKKEDRGLFAANS